ncbi:MAG: DUF4203 domain-containing protein [Phycisphaeraceae bacterium]
MHATPLLAQATEQNPFVNLFETVVHTFSRADALAQPEPLIEQLQALSVIWAIVFMIVGVTCLLNGYKFYKIATVMLALLIGAFAGYWLGQHIDAPFILAACLGLLMAVMALPLMKYAVALLGGLAGAFIGANLWTGFAAALNKTAETALPTDAYWVGALIGLLVCGMLAFILFKLSIVLFTSVSGSTIAVLGGIALLLSFEPWRESVAQGLSANQLVIPLLVLVPAVIGLIVQEAWSPQAKADGDADE